MFTKKGKKKQTKKDTSGNVTHYEMQSCLSKEYSSSHQTLKMFTLPKLILIPNSWSINTTLSSFVCVYFSSYFAPAWNKHYVSVSDQVFQRCDLQPRTFFFFCQCTFCINLLFNQWKPKSIKPRTSAQMCPFGATQFLPVRQPPFNKNLLSHQETSWRWISKAGCSARHSIWVSFMAYC